MSNRHPQMLQEVTIMKHPIPTNIGKHGKIVEILYKYGIFTEYTIKTKDNEKIKCIEPWISFGTNIAEVKEWDHNKYDQAWNNER